MNGSETPIGLGASRALLRSAALSLRVAALLHTARRSLSLSLPLPLPLLLSAAGSAAALRRVVERRHGVGRADLDASTFRQVGEAGRHHSLGRLQSAGVHS